MHIKGCHMVEFTSVPKDCLISANSADHDEMSHTVAFHLGLRCSAKFPFRGFQGLPWPRICCSQHFRQMEKVGAN